MKTRRVGGQRSGVTDASGWRRGRCVGRGDVRRCGKGLPGRHARRRPLRPRHQGRRVHGARRSSGCGKTTALRMLAGLEEISEGRVVIGERVVNHVPPRDRDIAMVFQSYALYPHLTVYENIAFGLRVQEGAEGRDRLARQGCGPHPRPRATARSQAAQPLRWPAPARRHGPRDRAPSAGVPHGRAALQPRREAARADARGDREVAARSRRDDDVRHA